MGFRFHKSMKFGPFRLNFSKKGVGWSAGVPGFRYTQKAGGGHRTTTSIPGTGISYVKQSGKKQKIRRSKAPHKTSQQSTGVVSDIPAGGLHTGGLHNMNWTWLCYRIAGIAALVFAFLCIPFSAAALSVQILAGLIVGAVNIALLVLGILWLRRADEIVDKAENKSRVIKIAAIFAIISVLFLIGALASGGGDNSNGTSDITAPVSTEMPTEAPTEAPTEIPTAEPTQAPTEAPTPQPTEAPTEAPTAAPTAEPTPKPTEAPVAAEPQGAMVWIAGSGNGTKYHSNPSCSNMKNPVEISLSEAQARGYGPCAKCY